MPQEESLLIIILGVAAVYASLLTGIISLLTDGHKIGRLLTPMRDLRIVNWGLITLLLNAFITTSRVHPIPVRLAVPVFVGTLLVFLLINTNRLLFELEIVARKYRSQPS